MGHPRLAHLSSVHSLQLGLQLGLPFLPFPIHLPPAIFFPKLRSLTVCPVSTPDTAMDRWYWTHVSCWLLPLMVASDGAPPSSSVLLMAWSSSLLPLDANQRICRVSPQIPLLPLISVVAVMDRDRDARSELEPRSGTVIVVVIVDTSLLLLVDSRLHWE